MQLPDDDARAEEEKAIGATSNLGKDHHCRIRQSRRKLLPYASVNAMSMHTNADALFSSSVTSPVVLRRREHGRSAKGPRRPKPRELFSKFPRRSLVAIRLDNPLMPTLPLSRSSDFENKFVCGEIMTFEDLKEYGSESAVKAVSLLLCAFVIANDKLTIAPSWL